MTTTIKTDDASAIKEYLSTMYIPPVDSHKGQNGKVLIIGGSSLFHSAALWAAEIATYFVDMVHFASTEENNQILTELKTKFRNGIVVRQSDISSYVAEDDATLIGSGMMREGEEGEYTKKLTQDFLTQFPDKRFVLDAGALQMMNPQWLLTMKEKPILTPHQLEFEQLFGARISHLTELEKAQVVEDCAKKYNCIILLKAVVDIISNGERTVVVQGGNAGLTKGGTGDTLAGLCTAFYAKNTPFESGILASFTLKSTADELFKTHGLYYNTEDLIRKIPQIFSRFAL